MATGAEALFAAVLAESPGRPLVTFYDDATGERIELSAKSLANWVAKTHFLLMDGLGLGVGDTALIALPADWISVAILLGCWSAGLAVSDTTTTGPAVAFSVADVPANVAEVYAVDRTSLGRSFGSTPPAGTADYAAAVRPQPDTWASVAHPGGPSDPALDGMTRAELTRRASERAADLGLVPRSRLLFSRPWTDPTDWIDAVLAPLSVGGSLVLVSNADPARQERRISQEAITDIRD